MMYRYFYYLTTRVYVLHLVHVMTKTVPTTFTRYRTTPTTSVSTHVHIFSSSINSEHVKLYTFKLELVLSFDFLWYTIHEPYLTRDLFINSLKDLFSSVVRVTWRVTSLVVLGSHVTTLGGKNSPSDWYCRTVLPHYSYRSLMNHLLSTDFLRLCYYSPYSEAFLYLT